MRYLPSKQLESILAGITLALAAWLWAIPALAQTPPPWSDVGTPMTPEDIRALPNDTGPSGQDLPPGRGTAKEGERIYKVKCSMCHGQNLEGVEPPAGTGSLFRGSALVGGRGMRLWGSYGPNPVSRANHVAYPTSLWNAIAVSMPFFQPGSLTWDEVYSLVALILARNEIIKEEMVLDRETLPQVVMPQRDNYIPARFEDILNVEQRGCFKTYGICEPSTVIFTGK